MAQATPVASDAGGGLSAPDEDGGENRQQTVVMALLLAQRITGVAVPRGVLDEPRLCAELEPRAAALAAAKPLTSEIPGLGDHALRAQMIEALRA